MSLHTRHLKFIRPLILAILVIALGSIQAHAFDLCKEGKKSLMGEYEVLQTAGGLWGHMEKFIDLKEKSAVGLQADGKLQRAIVDFENLCNSDKKPDQAMYDKIQTHLKKASAILHSPLGKTPTAEVLKSIQDINTVME